MLVATRTSFLAFSTACFQTADPALGIIQCAFLYHGTVRSRGSLYPSTCIGVHQVKQRALGWVGVSGKYLVTQLGNLLTQLILPCAVRGQQVLCLLQLRFPTRDGVHKCERFHRTGTKLPQTLWP